MVPTLIMGGLSSPFHSSSPTSGWRSRLTPVFSTRLTQANSPVSISLLKFGYLTESFGGLLFSFAIPMFAAFVANSIGGKLAFPAGFIGGLVATQPTLVLNFDAEN